MVGNGSAMCLEVLETLLRSLGTTSTAVLILRMLILGLLKAQVTLFSELKLTIVNTFF